MSCAEVCLDHNYESGNAFYSERMVTARKTHRCCECKRGIGPGDRYQRAAGKSSATGDIFSAATCALCTEIRQAFVCGSWMFGELWTSIEDGMFPIWDRVGPIDCLAKLETKAARDVCWERYHKWKDA